MQQTPARHVSPPMQHALPQLNALGQHVSSFRHCWFSWQQAVPHAWSAGQQPPGRQLAPLVQQVSPHSSPLVQQPSVVQTSPVLQH